MRLRALGTGSGSHAASDDLRTNYRGCYSAMYEYDDHGNLIKESVLYDGETIPGTMYYYKAVEVDAPRAPYLLEQQKYLISVP